MVWIKVVFQKCSGWLCVQMQKRALLTLALPVLDPGVYISQSLEKALIALAATVRRDISKRHKKKRFFIKKDTYTYLHLRNGIWIRGELKFWSCLTIRWNLVKKRKGMSLNIWAPLSLSFIYFLFFCCRTGCRSRSVQRGESRPACPLALGSGEDFKKSLRGRLLWKSHQGCPGRPSKAVSKAVDRCRGRGADSAPFSLAVRRDIKLAQQKETTTAVRPIFFT